MGPVGKEEFLSVKRNMAHILITTIEGNNALVGELSCLVLSSEFESMEKLHSGLYDLA